MGIEEEIYLINRIVGEAVWHGADCGGAYYQNEESLLKALNDWIRHKSLYDEYEIHNIDVRTADQTGLSEIPQIMKKGDI